MTTKLRGIVEAADVNKSVSGLTLDTEVTDARAGIFQRCRHIRWADLPGFTEPFNPHSLSWRLSELANNMRRAEVTKPMGVFLGLLSIWKKRKPSIHAG
ncbi:MAG: hypothetical protein ABI434_19540 [Burkholderiaceae bacterium]